MTQPTSASNAPPGREEVILHVLEADLSPIMAKCVLRFALSTTRLELDALRPGKVEPLLGELERGIRLYAPEKAKTCMRALRRTMETFAGASAPTPRTPKALPRGSGDAPPADAVVIPIVSEADIMVARHAGSKLCLALGFSKTEEVKAVTVISELARNIVSYAIRGQLSLRRWSNGTRIGIEIEAKDQGRGIPNLDDILAGRYRSKTGLGLGITGTRKLAESFEITTEVGKGTHVVARMANR